jgi:signal peptidase I
MVTNDLIYLVAEGQSMFPFIKSGDQLLVRAKDFRCLKVGDIILYQRKKTQVCHRVIKKLRSGEVVMFYTRGDSLIGAIEIVSVDNYIGQIIGYKRGDKFILLDVPWRKCLAVVVVYVIPYVISVVRFLKNHLPSLYAFLRRGYV